jgi:ribose transport system substrate-binding protein
MAAGSRKAFSEVADGDRERWMNVPFTGCDGVANTGLAWVRSGVLAATIHIRPNTDLALEMLTESIRSGSPVPEQKLTVPESIPTLQELANRGNKPGAEKLHRGAGA